MYCYGSSRCAKSIGRCCTIFFCCGNTSIAQIKYSMYAFCDSQSREQSGARNLGKLLQTEHEAGTRLRTSSYCEANSTLHLPKQSTRSGNENVIFQTSKLKVVEIFSETLRKKCWRLSAHRKVRILDTFEVGQARMEKG